MMHLNKRFAGLRREAFWRGVVAGAGVLVLLAPGVKAQEGAPSGILRITRKVLDAAGGAMSGPRNFRVRSSSLGSGLQTGALTGRLRITSGFVQRDAMNRASTDLAGDFNGDGRVDFDDFFLFAAAFGSRDSRFDLSRDGQVNFDDFFIFAAQFGKRR